MALEKSFPETTRKGEMNSMSFCTTVEYMATNMHNLFCFLICWYKFKSIIPPSKSTDTKVEDNNGRSPVDSTL